MGALIVGDIADANISTTTRSNHSTCSTRCSTPGVRHHRVLVNVRHLRDAPGAADSGRSSVKSRQTLWGFQTVRRNCVAIVFKRVRYPLRQFALFQCRRPGRIPAVDIFGTDYETPDGTALPSIVSSDACTCSR